MARIIYTKKPPIFLLQSNTAVPGSRDIVIDHEVNATSVACPTCHAWVGWACEGAEYGYHAAGYHPRRIKLARGLK